MNNSSSSSSNNNNKTQTYKFTQLPKDSRKPYLDKSQRQLSEGPPCHDSHRQVSPRSGFLEAIKLCRHRQDKNATVKHHSGVDCFLSENGQSNCPQCMGGVYGDEISNNFLKQKALTQWGREKKTAHTFLRPEHKKWTNLKIIWSFAK